MLFLHVLVWSCGFYLSFCLCSVLCYQAYIHRINPTWSWSMILLMYCWICFANILLRILAYMFIRVIGLSYSFFVVSFSSFRIRIMLTSENGLQIVLSQRFYNSLRRKKPETLIQKNICNTNSKEYMPFTIAMICKHPKCPSVDE